MGSLIGRKEYINELEEIYQEKLSARHHRQKCTVSTN